LSENRRRIRWRIVGFGVLLQIIIGVLVMGIPSLGVPALLRVFFSAINDGVNSFLAFTDAGSSFVFGPLVDEAKSGGFIFAVKVLPTIVFFSSLVAVLYHLGVLQLVIKFFANMMRKAMGVGGAESLSLAGE